MRMYLSEVASESVPTTAPAPAPVPDPNAIANQKIEAAKTQREADHANLVKKFDEEITKAGQDGATLDCASKALAAFETKEKSVET